MGCTWVYYPKMDGDAKKMANLKETSQAYEPPKTLNIAELDKIPIDIEVFDGSGKDNEGKEFKYKFAKIDGKEYRIAGTILGGIKALLEKMPNIKNVTVLRQGMGMATRYQVIPYTAPEVSQKKAS